MSKLALVTARSPARAALAERIAERDHVAGVLETRKRDSVESPYNFDEREGKLEAAIREASTSASMNTDHYRRERATAARTAALLRGEQPPEEEPTAEERVAALKAELETLQAQWRRSRALAEKRTADVTVLERELRDANDRIATAAREVVSSEGGFAAVLAEHDYHAARAAFLARALDPSQLTLSDTRTAPDLSAAKRTALAAPCPWAVAAELLRTDPDAPLPTVEAALASVGGPRPSSRAAA